MKKCPLSLAIKEMQIKNILRFHLTLVEQLSSKTAPKACVGEEAGKK
jgi:hypothetical protein